MATEVKKVKPYPFKGSLKDSRGSYLGQVVKLTLQGVMIEVAGSSVQPGDKVEINFTTPVLGGVVLTAGVVVKVYNQLTGGAGIPAPASGAPDGAVGLHLVEVHFKSVPPDSLTRIAQYLEHTGQAKR